MQDDCKRCLIYESGEKVTYQEIMDYISTIDRSKQVTSEVYNKRISLCKSCDNLISGMCRKCGCYVEVRARLKDKGCPNVDNKLW